MSELADSSSAFLEGGFEATLEVGFFALDSFFSPPPALFFGFSGASFHNTLTWKDDVKRGYNTELGPGTRTADIASLADLSGLAFFQIGS